MKPMDLKKSSRTISSAFEHADCTKHLCQDRDRSCNGQEKSHCLILQKGRCTLRHCTTMRRTRLSKYDRDRDSGREECFNELMHLCARLLVLVIARRVDFDGTVFRRISYGN